MSTKEKIQFIKEISNHIRYTSGKLYDFGILKDTSPLLASAGQLLASLNPESATAETYIDNLIFINVDPDRKMRKIRPKSVNLDLGYELIVNAEYRLCLPVQADYDPFKSLTVNFRLEGMNAEGTVYNSWHIDRHISEGDEISYFPHPLYHIQYGGKEMTENENLDYGSTLLVDSPRIPFAPVDVLLIIDYVLLNYYGSIWYDLQSDIRYKDGIRLSQKTIWGPYYNSIHKGLTAPGVQDNEFSYKEINPSLI